MSDYANIIIDISVECLDRPFTYRIPAELSAQIKIGTAVIIPFGKSNKEKKGYVVSFTNTLDFDPALAKDILRIDSGKVDIGSQFLELAWWMKTRYACTMNQALKTVMPVKASASPLSMTSVRLSADVGEVAEFMGSKKCGIAQYRLLDALLDEPEILVNDIYDKLNIHPATINSLVSKGLIEKKTFTYLRDPVNIKDGQEQPKNLNKSQSDAVERIWEDHISGENHTWLLHGITGSGKTEVYLELIERVISEGRQAIVLIPEISLTYQTVMRFYRRFGKRVSIVNSRLSSGERYDQFLKAQNGEIDIMIGPRSALFTPFNNLGLIVIDEEHEDSYKSEKAPRYNSREVAIHRCVSCGGFVVLGSATPSVETTYLADAGIYKKAVLNERAVSGSALAKVTTVDMRLEMKNGNRSILSRALHDMIDDRLKKNEQVMLFLNRRGYSNFISCRSCGEAIMCPNCDISMTYHQDNTLRCHYCGHVCAVPKVCPTCGSRYLAGLGIGTEKAVGLVQTEFPTAKILRMDMDTTAAKGAHEKILEAFRNHEADILLGTQMIVKGHDFPNVTLVGILVADKSLYASSYRASEKTFQLLTQAAGRAGRGDKPGDVVIQTYRPDHYAIVSAAAQDYQGFYDREIGFRKAAGYPPVNRMMSILLESTMQKIADESIDEICGEIRKNFTDGIEITDPAPDTIGRINNYYRRVMFIKSTDIDMLMDIQSLIEDMTLDRSDIQVQIDII